MKNTNKKAINTPTARARKKSTVDGAFPPKVLDENPDELPEVSEGPRVDDAVVGEWVEETMAYLLEIH